MQSLSDAAIQQALLIRLQPDLHWCHTQRALKETAHHCRPGWPLRILGKRSRWCRASHERRLNAGSMEQNETGEAEINSFYSASLSVCLHNTTAIKWSKSCYGSRLIWKLMHYMIWRRGEWRTGGVWSLDLQRILLIEAFEQDLISQRETAGRESIGFLLARWPVAMLC